jgi:hypothetical protein
VSDELDVLDAKAAVLARGYLAEGEVGFVLRTINDGDVRLIAPAIAHKLIITACRTLADQLEKRSYTADERRN